MKNIIIAVLSTIFFTSTSSGQSYEKGYILTLSVELYLNTSYNIPCSSFATAFKNQLSLNKISESDSIKTFSFFVQNAKYARYNREIDVRRKYIYEVNNEDSTTVCSDGRNIILNGRLIKRNKKFINFLNSMIK